MSRICAAYLLPLVLFTAAARAQDLSAPLPLDPAIRTGTLPNGLTFFIRRNAEPPSRVALRLAIEAGSIDEADDQRGLAHLLEHMAFNGSSHFKAGELVSYLESIGSRFGPDVNAYTSFDETVYMLEVPTDREGLLERGLEALGDFAGGMTLDTAEVDRERGVVIEEWRLRQGAATRMQDAQLEAIFGESRYTDRLPIGLPETLKTFPAERLRDFYRDFYRADRMAVIAVGDVDPARMEALIRAHFADVRGAAPAPRVLYPVPPHEETRYVSVSDREAQGSAVTLIHKRPLQRIQTVGDYRGSLVRGLVHQMLNARFAEIARRPGALFLRARSGEQTIGRDTEAVSVSVRVEDGGIPKGLEAVGQEIARVRQHGFGDAELDRARKETLVSYERAYNERDKSQSVGFASELVRYFLTGEASPGIAVELELVRRFLPAITADEVAALARDLLGERNRVVLATSPEKEGVPVVTQAGLREALAAGASATVEAWKDTVEGLALMVTLPEPGSVRARREIPEIGVTVLTLSNGVEVWLKPTDFRNDQVMFTSYARGGSSLAPPEAYHDASLSTTFVSLSGIAGLSPVDLDKILAGRIASASPFMATYTHGIGGGATPRDLETALQLVHLYFIAPNRDPEAFELLQRRLEAGLANQAESPGTVFGERLRSVNTLDHYTMRPMRPEDVGRLNRQRMIEYYEARFRNAADFTFFFVGAFSVDQITPLLTRYLASLPSTGTASGKDVDLELRFPTAVKRERVNKGQEPTSQTAITFFSDTGLEEFASHRLNAAGEVLQMRLRNVLREELGGTYSVSVSHADTSPHPGYGTTSVRFGSAPDNADRLTEVVMAELDRLRKDGPTAAEVQAVKETEKRQLETAVRQNGYWLSSLESLHLLGRDARGILRRTARAESLTAENIHAAFRKYFPQDRYTVVTLMPDAGAPAAAAAQ